MERNAAFAAVPRIAYIFISSMNIEVGVQTSACFQKAKGQTWQAKLELQQQKRRGAWPRREIRLHPSILRGGFGLHIHSPAVFVEGDFAVTSGRASNRAGTDVFARDKLRAALPDDDAAGGDDSPPYVFTPSRLLSCRGRCGCCPDLSCVP